MRWFAAFLFLLVSNVVRAGPGNIDPADGKTAVIDNSKGEETPPIVSTGCARPADTEFRIGLPGWMSDLSGDFGVAGLVSDQQVNFGELFKRLDMVVAGSLYARYQRWEIFADGQYLKLHDTAQLGGLLFESARVSLKSAFAEGFIGYRLINCERGFLSLYAGARYNYMSGDFHLRGARLRSRRASGSTDWVDPVIGLAGRVRIWKALSLWANFDGGGFDANSDSAFELTRSGPLRISRVPISSEDWTYQVRGGVEIQVTRWLWSDIGWRHLKYNYVSGGFTNKTELSGPFIETGVNF
jgi:hypothetical protein